VSGRGHALVIGGGYAGIAAALVLSDHGDEVTLLEARRHWGGRATSWPDPRMRDELDNGQHVWMGCYDRARALLSRLGTEGRVAFAPGLDLAYRDLGGRAHRLRAPALLGRAGLALALARFGAIPLGERVGLARALANGLPPAPGATAAAWLDALGQGPAAQRVFWGPLAEAALNLPLAEADAALLHAVVVRSFRGPASLAAIGLPRAGLASLVAPAADLLAARGGRARLGAAVRAVSPAGRAGGYAVELESGEALRADRVVLAVPAAEAHALVTRDLSEAARRLEAAAALPASPIVTATLWFERRVLDTPVVGLIPPPAGGGPGFHWVFDRGALVARAGEAWPVAMVAGAARELCALPTAQIVERARAALEAYGLTRLAPIASRVVKEPRATPSFDPAGATRRPGAESGHAGLAFAGDWTATGLPATIEGAVVSGEAAARAVLGSAILPPTSPPSSLRPEGTA
jgi:zeta-carotene desaturase